jgi:hypothetical protein
VGLRSMYVLTISLLLFSSEEDDTTMYVDE